ncbi:MAG: CDP-diacylglycerol--serine O-phosphatidyltransferase [Reyranella sp.]|jgi:CDP-diacylglycerol--serine O-phosphatidyltransferase|uniref:CDP-diacylglycerol--serine O-phosphatidyltransferase n=1 Tax=Reyranella sp. TaxID=1929291 RepID=UPI000959936E|nr:CDP-diacylglycerol--serine O-phosphatidyltransferase [Reyranella sp.]MBN9541103.1 CDP-diacylglycerol--serine O-phosphatidyltransferase [Alphaproteobacteria bacterium]MBR2818308.1 CDP-diacylglycerol--serine O-phosphatidyltransferase [Reyranella sp.]OJU32834.1 MAG: CDP-diacylglycerol--serine O-phosphatidyltransferase [Alphaproteobacteria bacterium 65-37]
MDDDLRSRRGRLRGFSINRLIPNVLTLAALCSGLTAIRFALQGEMRLAVIAIIVAAIFDALDGRVARRLGVTSRFGAELDSLSDFLCFGVAPALVLYLASLREVGSLGWMVVLMFPICSALRLARFNTALVSDTPPPAWTGQFFTGVPAPAGALLALMPLMVSFEIEAAWPRHALVVGVVLVVVGGLMVSRLPTFSFKKGRVPRHLVLPALLGAALVMTVIASSPWIGLSLLGLGYMALIPFSWVAYRRQAQADRQSATAAGEIVPLRAVDPHD